MDASRQHEIFEDKYERKLGLAYSDWLETAPTTEDEAYARCQQIDDELKDTYLQLLGQLESITRESDPKLMPDNWRKEQNVDNFLTAIQFIKRKIEEEKEVRKGLATPHTVEEQRLAVSNAVAKDDFYERKK